MESLTAALVQAKSKTDNLKMITSLSVWSIGFHDVSILRQMVSLEIVSLPVNRISTLKDFQGLAKLRELSVRDNCIRDLRELLYLRKAANARITAIAILPQLKKLNNIEITQNERQQSLNIDLEQIENP
jgi:cilla- and flagella-associated protein